MASASDSVSQKIQELKSSLTKSQEETLEHAMSTKHSVVAIQGPPGCGKTFFLTKLLHIASLLKIRWIACAPSNAATDHLATELNNAFPAMGAIRHHALESECGTIKREARKFEDPDSPEPEPEIEPESNEPLNDEELEDVDASIAFNAVVLRLTSEHGEWTRNQVKRPNKAVRFRTATYWSTASRSSIMVKV